MKNTTRKGDKSEARVLSYLVNQGYDVLVPYSSGCAYDLAFDDNGSLVRVQVKTGRMREGVVIANLSRSSAGSSSSPYSDTAFDWVAVCCPDTDEVYWIHWSECPRSEVRFRVDPPGQGQRVNVRFAEHHVGLV